ncbi:hypothetical protein LTR37_005494 [Vermiconidia calcicola]|uniref:Uncharacterized protein n=1 Tax=Vermiconidia calcicola TaxID=1690605 RepID=A0ACC3NIK7_9PEZI|nr:hypothetical protein LTR37_005494 [Vermiconidia calcicola]
MGLIGLTGQTAMITGAARGLGLSFASVVAQAHANVAVLDVLDAPSQELLDFRSLSNVEVEYYTCDISVKTQVTDAISRVEQEFARIDINVNAAGVVTDSSFIETSEETLKRTFAINFNVSFLVAQACATSMINRIKASADTVPVDPAVQGGSIIFIASISIHIPSVSQNISAYMRLQSCGMRAS